MKRALKKLSKSEKRRGAELREEIEWLRNKLSKQYDGPSLMDSARLNSDNGKLTYTRIEDGNRKRFQEYLTEMELELATLYNPENRTKNLT